MIFMFLISLMLIPEMLINRLGSIQLSIKTFRMSVTKEP